MGSTGFLFARHPPGDVGAGAHDPRAAYPRRHRDQQTVNRNYDFLHNSGIGTSAAPCNDVFRVPNAFSEPGTRNVRWFLDTYPHIAGLIDIHSYSKLILWPWGDDDNQTTNPAVIATRAPFRGFDHRK